MQIFSIQHALKTLVWKYFSEHVDNVEDTAIFDVEDEENTNDEMKQGSSAKGRKMKNTVS